MPRHRAPSNRHHALSSLALTGAALGASLFSPLTAAAAAGAGSPSTHPARPGTTSGGARCDDVVPGSSADLDPGEVRKALADADPGEVVCVPVDADSDTGTADGSYPSRREHTHRHRHVGPHHHATRPMTSGERQQRIGCLQGYIVDDCERFSVESLRRRGIDPSR